MGATTSKQQEEHRQLLSSIQDYSQEDVASHVASFGDKYKGYAEQIREKQIDGSVLASLILSTTSNNDSNSDNKFHALLDDLNVTLRLHRRKLEREFQKAVTVLQEGEDDWMLEFSSSNVSADETTTSSSSNTEEASGKTPTSRRRRRGHNPTHSDVSVEMIMKVALHAQKLDNQISDLSDNNNNQVSTFEALDTPSHHSTGTSTSSSSSKHNTNNNNEHEHTNAVLEAAIAAQAMETESLQNDVRDLEFTRELDDTTGFILPKGIVTIVLTDIEHSTNLWEANPEAMRRALIIHDDIQRQLRAKHFGYEIDTAGDAFFLAFSEPGDALAFALELQTTLNTTADWADEILELPWAKEDGERRGLRVRVAIHTGPAETVKNAVTGRTEYEGEAMTVAQKIEGMARGGQILASSDTWNAAFHLADVKLGSPIVTELSEPVVLEKDAPQEIGVTAKRVFDIAPSSLPPLTEATKEKSTSNSRQEVVQQFPPEAVALATIANNSCEHHHHHMISQSHPLKMQASSKSANLKEKPSTPPSRRLTTVTASETSPVRV